MAGSSSVTTCKPLLQKFEILILPFQYIFSLMRLQSRNLEIYKFNSSFHGVNTRHKFNLGKSSNKLTLYQKGVYRGSIKICNKLLDISAEFVSNKKCF